MHSASAISLSHKLPKPVGRGQSLTTVADRHYRQTELA